MKKVVIDFSATSVPNNSSTIEDIYNKIKDLTINYKCKYYSDRTYLHAFGVQELNFWNSSESNYDFEKIDFIIFIKNKYSKERYCPYKNKAIETKTPYRTILI